MTINEALVLMKVVREKVNTLRGVRQATSTRTSWFSSENENKTITPEYDFKELDRRISSLELFLFKTEAKIKESNAKVKIQVDETADELLSPLP